MDEEQLCEFPVYIEEKNEIITLFLSKKAIERATQDEAFLTELIAKETKQQQINEVSVAPVEHTDENAVDKNNADKSKVFVWPDKAVLLLLEMYREREEDFSTGLKRSNKIWTEIAAEMKEANSLYKVTGPQSKKKRVEHVLEELVENIATEIEEKKEERKRREAKHEEIREENRRDRERRHKEQMDVQKSLVSILQQFLK
ncbi:PREDICTED: uncharacterized protein LOC108771848 [Cyphomyrmex costatus]|uniref:uncharacterized protein LOC108771848 n=1 Tax=Cyphomyrmex costatus TaxID=456900 RepID=UPI0008523631|nr:PREDICTED: uncharacterized protein LOC108771848 [Cyphomyrmex costatus]